MAKEIIGEVKLTNVRASFADTLFKAKAFEEGATPKYGGSFLIDRSTDAGKRLVKACDAAIDAAIAKRFEGKKALSRSSMKNDCFYDGDDKDYDGYAGMQVVSAKNSNRIPVFDKDKNPITAEDGVIYSGCYVDAIVQFYIPKDEKYKNRICCSLQGVKFRADGEAFAGRKTTADDFDDEDEDMV